MTISIILSGLFAGIIISVIFISVIPKASIWILETIRLYRKNSLYCEYSDYVTGSGYHRRGRVYYYTNKNGSTRFESACIFGALLLLSTPLSIAGSLIIYILS